MNKTKIRNFALLFTALLFVLSLPLSFLSLRKTSPRRTTSTWKSTRTKIW